LNPLAEKTCFSQVRMLAAKLQRLEQAVQAALVQVTKTPRWPLSWAIFSLL
jgi:hypothetical protein